jgi:hypothetical protein
MQLEPNRPLQLLRNAGIIVHEEHAAKPIPLPHAKQAWVFSTADGRFTLWIYEFEDQDEMDLAMSYVEEQLIAQRQVLDFAQNGEFLLVLALRAQGEEMPEDRQAVARILQAFSGEVER